jgi:galactofuranose transport system substrate-binding protein
MKMTKLLGIGSLAMVGALGACGSNDNAAGTTGNTGKTCSTLPPMAPITAATKIGFVQLYEASGLWRTANTNSIVDEAAKRGYTLIYTPGTTDAAQEQVSRIQALIDAKVDAIIVAPHDETTISPMVVAARKACIPVFIEDRGVDNTVAIPGVDYVTLIGSDMVKEGQLTAQWLIAKTGGNAKIIEFEGTIGSSAAVGRKQGFDSEIAKQPGMQIVVSESADFDVKTGHDVALQLLPKYPAADWIFSHNDGMSFGIIQAMQELGMTPGKDKSIVSIDGTKQGAQDVADGLIAEITECNPKFGPIVFDTIEKYSQGQAIPTSMMNTDRTFDATNIASYLPEAF